MRHLELSSGMEHPPLQWDALLSRCMGRSELAERIVMQFQDGLEDVLTELSQAISAEDRGETARLAHRLKGTSLTVSAEELAHVAERIEEAALAGRLDVVASAWNDLQGARVRLADTISRHRDEAATCRS